MYGQTCRFETPPSATSVYVAPDTYDVDLMKCEPNKARVPFLVGSRRKISWVNPQHVRNPAPNLYRTEKYVKHRVKGGQTPRATDERFIKPTWIKPGTDTGPGPATYGACISFPVAEKLPFPIPPCGDITCSGGPECKCRRMKGVRRRAPFRGPCDLNVPSIPKKGSLGYYQVYPCGPWCPVPTVQPSLSPSPEYYDIRKTSCYCTDKYKGNFWSRMQSKRLMKTVEGPGPGYYEGDLQYQWNGLYDLKMDYEHFRAYRRFTSCAFRFPETLMIKARKENYPAANEYDIQDKDCCQVMEGVPFPPFKQGSLRFKDADTDIPAGTDTQWYIPDSFDELRKVKSRIEPPFQSNTERFKREYATPGPGDYAMPKGIGDKDSCSPPDWSVLCPFGSSSARNTSYLIEDPCHPSPARYFKFPRNKKKCCGYASYKSVTERFPDNITCEPDCATYDVGEAALRLVGRCEHLHPDMYCRAPFLAGEERFRRVNDWPEKGYDPSVPGPTDYNIVVNSVGKPKLGTIARAKCKCKCKCGPAPNHYFIHPQYLESPVYNSFNVRLNNPLPRETSKPPSLPYARRVAMRKKLRCFVERTCPLIC